MEYPWMPVDQLKRRPARCCPLVFHATSGVHAAAPNATAIHYKRSRSASPFRHQQWREEATASTGDEAVAERAQCRAPPASSTAALALTLRSKRAQASMHSRSRPPSPHPAPRARGSAGWQQGEQRRLPTAVVASTSRGHLRDQRWHRCASNRNGMRRPSASCPNRPTPIRSAGEPRQVEQAHAGCMPASRTPRTAAGAWRHALTARARHTM